LPKELHRVNASLSQLLLRTMTSPIAKTTRRLCDDIRSSWLKPALNDVLLQGVQGEPIGASKFILASRSEVFRKLLYEQTTDWSLVLPQGDGQDTTSTSQDQKQVLKIKYPSKVIKRFVHFCYTDEVELDTEEIAPESGNPNADTRTLNAGDSLVALLDAAHFYEVERLAEITLRRLVRLMTAVPAVACRVVTHFHGAEEKMSPDSLPLPGDYIIKALAAKVIQFRPHLALSAVSFEKYTKGDPSEICLLINGETAKQNESMCLAKLISWVKESPDRRLEAARKAVEALALEKVSPKVLAKMMEETCVLQETKALAAFRFQALQAADGKLKKTWEDEEKSQQERKQECVCVTFVQTGGGGRRLQRAMMRLHIATASI
jgi:hypothetical protein